MNIKLPTLNTVASASVLMSALAMTACSSGGSSPTSTTLPTAEGTAAYVVANQELKGDFEENVTLDAGQTYKITGAVNFREGTTLTIPAGTTLYGTTGASYLAINRGATIMAEGTAAAPIVLTSAEDIAGTASKNDQGQWGGLTILGQSTNNKGERTYEADDQAYSPKDGVTIADDNSGVLEYVVIKYSGFAVEKDKELNGLSLASVGSGTEINNIAIIGSADDGVEFWGGTVDVENLFIYNAGDDSIDTDQGYTGTITNAYVQQVVVDDEIDSRAIEADSYDEDDAFNPDPATPADQQIISKPSLVNATLNTIGRAVRLREGTGYVFNNVQVNVKSSSADTSAASYIEDIAAIRVSQTDITGAEIETAGVGIAVVNEAVELDLSSSSAGDIGSDGKVTNGKGIYQDSGTSDVFRDSLSIHETVGVTQGMIDEGYRGSDGMVFSSLVAVDNTVTGADLTAL